MDFSCSSPASSSSSRLLDSCPRYLPSISCPFLLLTDSYTSCSDSRQPPYTETSSERRARLEFLQKEKNKGARQEEDRARSRVASWVQSQVDNSAFMVMATAAQKQKRRNKGRQPEPRIASQRSGSSLRFSYVPSDDEEEEQSGIHSKPTTKCRSPSPSQSSYTSKTHVPQYLPPSSKRRRRTRRLASSTSSLDSIPEE